jgi:hypothetical protein
MNSDTAVGTTFPAVAQNSDPCGQLFSNAATGKVSRHIPRRGDFIRHCNTIIRRRLRPASIVNIMSAGYRYRSHCVEQAARTLHSTTRNISRALAGPSTAFLVGDTQASIGG